MKNNKMKKIISMMVAILVVFSALTVHASATWYEFTGSNSESFGSPFWDSYAGASGSSNSGYCCWTGTQHGDATYIYVDATFVYNLGNGTSESFVDRRDLAEDENHPEPEGEVEVDSYSIPSDYTIYSFTSYHYVSSGEESDFLYISTSS